jgi:diadenosine tetraphosphatase ApaH/serine/threonine PP2A family protein phosphatase
MRIGIISDIHGNLEALQAVLADLESRQADEIVCLGDIVGYGAEPGVCLDIVLETCSVVVAGNHDHAAVGLLNAANFNPLAKHAMEYARDRLTASQRQQLRDLPIEAILGDLLLVHASPYRPEDFPYLHDLEDARLAFAERPFTIAVCGHTHVPLTFREIGEPDPEVRLSLNPTIDVSPPGRTICNVGSVGQPRDRDPRACFAIYDSAAQILELRRTSYDIESASGKIEAAGLPEALGRRLLAGV